MEIESEWLMSGSANKMLYSYRLHPIESFYWYQLHEDSAQWDASMLS